MLSFLDCIKNWTVKSRELRKFWYWKIIACCSSPDFKAKLREEAISAALNEPSFIITIPSRISLIGTNSCADFAVTLGMVLYPPGRLLYIQRPGEFFLFFFCFFFYLSSYFFFFFFFF